MIVSVDKWKAKGVFLARAEQYSRSMDRAFDMGDWDACIGNATHCAISAQDAFCVHMKGQRYRGTDHREALVFFKGVGQGEQHKKDVQRLAALIAIKTDAEYGDKVMIEKDARMAKLSAERFLAQIKVAVA